MKTDFCKPGTLSEALSCLEKYEDRAVVVNGGTDIVAKIASYEVDPEMIVYIQKVGALREIREDDNYLMIGGAVTYRDILESPLCAKYSGLIQSIGEVGSPSIRNVGTPAGNIANGAPAADCGVMLLALEADVVLASTRGERTATLDEILLEPFKTTIKRDELIKAIRVPRLSPDTCTAFVKMYRRKAQDIARVSVGVSLNLEGTVCKDICIALGAVNKVPVRARSLENLLVGQEMTEGLAAIKDVFPAEATPRKNYKKLVTNPVIGRAIRKAYAMAKAGGDNIG